MTIYFSWTKKKHHQCLFFSKWKIKWIKKKNTQWWFYEQDCVEEKKLKKLIYGQHALAVETMQMSLKMTKKNVCHQVNMTSNLNDPRDKNMNGCQKSFFQDAKIIHITNDILNPQEQNISSRRESARSPGCWVNTYFFFLLDVRHE